MTDPEEIRRFRSAIGQFATGVCVVTAFSENGPTGMTANAITSLSLEPLLMIVCFDRTARTRAAAEASGRVAVNVLSSEQEEISKVFASKATEEEKFAGVGWKGHAGAPVLDGSIGWFAGALTDLRPGGDHEIGIVAVEDFGVGPGDPLLYHRGAYARMMGETP
ncbi:MAG: flavin reductase family protein [Solirubrobacterales bacterium]